MITRMVNMAEKKWIQKAIPKSHLGLLHKELKVPQGKKIPQSKLTKALHSTNPRERKQANLAKTLRGLRK